MRVFLTGGTGFVGSAIIADLLRAGHRVSALARSDDSAKALTVAGAEAHRGDLQDLDSLRRGAAAADAVIHAAFDHDFSKFVENSEIDRAAIAAMGDALEGSQKAFIVTSGLPPTPGRACTEDDVAGDTNATPRVSEQTALAMVDRGVRVSIIRMSQVHDLDKQGFATYIVPVAREKGVSAYIGEGQNRWAGVHRLDAAALYRLALESNIVGGRYHAVADEGIALRDVAEAIGRGLNIPAVSLSAEQAAEHFGWLARIVGMDVPASSKLTQERLGWRPANPSFLADLEQSNLFKG